jgi:hypothetical protein
MTIKRRNRINGQWSARLIEMLESPAYRVLSLAAHRLISRIEIELASHGGNDNGRLPVTYQDFLDYGVHRDAVAPAIREAEALGFIQVTEHGRGGNAEYRQPNKFFLTFAHGRDSLRNPPPHNWRKIKTLDEAKAIARAARENKDPRAVAYGHRRARKTKKPTPEFGVEASHGFRGRKRKNPDPGIHDYSVTPECGTTFYSSVWGGAKHSEAACV